MRIVFWIVITLVLQIVSCHSIWLERMNETVQRSCVVWARIVTLKGLLSTFSILLKTVFFVWTFCATQRPSHHFSLHEWDLQLFVWYLLIGIGLQDDARVNRAFCWLIILWGPSLQSVARAVPSLSSTSYYPSSIKIFFAYSSWVISENKF